MKTDTPTCIHCRQPIISHTPRGYSSTWIHLNGQYECRPTFAAPNFQDTREVEWEVIDGARLLAHELDGLY